MKRIIIILVIAFLCTGLMQAQTKILGRKVFDRGIQSHTFIPKGQWMVGSTFSYSEHEDDNYKFLVLEKIESTGYTFKVSPFFGYFIRDNVALGGRFSYNRTYTDLGNISLDLDDDINFDISDVNYLEHTFSATGFVRTNMKWTDQTTDQIDKGSRRSSSANFKIDLFSINLGMNFYF